MKINLNVYVVLTGEHDKNIKIQKNLIFWPFFSIFKKMAFFSYFWQYSYISAKMYSNKKKYFPLESTKAKLQNKTNKPYF